MKSLANTLSWNPRDLEAARFRTGIKILVFFSNKRVNFKLQSRGRGNRESQKQT